jgi:hypothetical protein
VPLCALPHITCELARAVSFRRLVTVTVPRPNRSLMDSFSQWVEKGPDARIGLQQSFTSPPGVVGALPYHGPRSRLPNLAPVSPRYGVHKIEDTLNELTRPRQAAADSSLWGRLQRTDESVQAQKVIRPLPHEPLPPQNTPRDGIYVEGEYVERREKGDAEEEYAVRTEPFPERLGHHFESWMQEHRDAQEQAAQGLTPRRGQVSFDRRMEREDQLLTGPICGLMAGNGNKQELAGASPRSYGVRTTDVTEMLGAASRGIPDGSYPATDGRSPEGRGFAWGGRHVNCLDMHQEGHLLHRQHVYKPYEPHLQVGEIGFGRSRRVGLGAALETNGIFPGSFLSLSPRAREVALMHQKADAGGYRRSETDVQFPARVPTRREADAPEINHSQVSTDLHKETWSRGYQLQTNAHPSASAPYGPTSRMNYGRRITGVHHPAAKKPTLFYGIGDWDVFINPS